MAINSTTKQHSGNSCQPEKKHKTQEVKAKKKYIGNVNKNVTNEDIYKIFGLKTSEYLYQTSNVDLKCLNKQKPKILALLHCTRFCLVSTYRAKRCRC